MKRGYRILSDRSVEVDQYEICGMSSAPVMAAVVVVTALRTAPMTTSVPDKSPSARTDLAAVPPLSSSRN